MGAVYSRGDDVDTPSTAALSKTPHRVDRGAAFLDKCDDAINAVLIDCPWIEAIQVHQRFRARNQSDRPVHASSSQTVGDAHVLAFQVFHGASSRSFKCRMYLVRHHGQEQSAHKDTQRVLEKITHIVHKSHVRRVVTVSSHA